MECFVATERCFGRLETAPKSTRVIVREESPENRLLYKTRKPNLSFSKPLFCCYCLMQKKVINQPKQVEVNPAEKFNTNEWKPKF